MKKLVNYSFILVLAIVASLCFLTTSAQAAAVTAVSVGITPPVYQQTETKTVPVGNTQVDLFDTNIGGIKIFRQSVNRSGNSIGCLYNDQGVFLRLIGNCVTSDGKAITKLVAVRGDNPVPKFTKVEGIWTYPHSDQITELTSRDGSRLSCDVPIDGLKPGSHQITLYAFCEKGIRKVRTFDTSAIVFGLLPFLPKINNVSYENSTDLVDIIQFTIVDNLAVSATSPTPPTDIPMTSRMTYQTELPKAPTIIYVPTPQQAPERIITEVPVQPPTIQATPTPAVSNPPAVPVVKIEETLAALVANDNKIAEVVNNHEARIVRLETAYTAPPTPTSYSFSVAFARNYRGPSIVETTEGLDIVNDITLNCLSNDGTWQARVIWAPVNEQYRNVFLLPGYEQFKKRIGVARYSNIKDSFRVGYRVNNSSPWNYATIQPTAIVQGKILVVPVDQGGTL
ncbi:MAG: hypothetical protein WC227_02610 [Patescibacteria group bacterium]|jgi:hypothetical protein